MPSGLHSKWVRGNLIHYVDREDKWVAGIGPTAKHFFEDFAQPNIDAGLLQGWANTVTEVGSGNSTHLPKAVEGKLGILRWDGDTNAGDGIQSQLLCETWKLEAGKPLYFGVHWSVSETLMSDMVLGLCITDTTLTTGMTDGVYFRSVDNSMDLTCVTEKGSSETESASVATLVGNTFLTTEFFFGGDGCVRFYVDDVLAATHTTNIPDTEYLTVSIAYFNGLGGPYLHDGIDVD